MPGLCLRQSILRSACVPMRSHANGKILIITDEMNTRLCHWVPFNCFVFALTTGVPAIWQACARYLGRVCPLFCHRVPAIVKGCARDGVLESGFGEWFWSVPAKCARYQKVIKSVKLSFETVAGTLSRALSTSTCDGPARGTCAMQPPLHSSRGGPGGLGGPWRLQQALEIFRRPQAPPGGRWKSQAMPAQPQEAPGGRRWLQAALPQPP